MGGRQRLLLARLGRPPTEAEVAAQRNLEDNPPKHVAGKMIVDVFEIKTGGDGAMQVPLDAPLLLRLVVQYDEQCEPKHPTFAARTSGLEACVCFSERTLVVLS